MITKQRVLSCIQPTGGLHIGNYFGAIKNWVRLQNEEKYQCIFGVVDLHAMTMPYRPKDLAASTTNLVIELLACGIDPEKSILFIQSFVPQHTELAWILGCVTSYGELSRMTQFKDKADQLESIGSDHFVSAGLFTYPILQAADILTYRAQFVPVGKDQEQHLELARNIAARFNRQFGDYFLEPQPLYTETPKLGSLGDPLRKMSKSLGERHYIGLFENEEYIRRKVRSAVTDIGDEQKSGVISAGVENLFNILKSCGAHDIARQLHDEFVNGNLKYASLKEATADALIALTAEFKEAKQELEKDTATISRQITRMSQRAREIAEGTINDVRKLTGLPILV